MTNRAFDKTVQEILNDFETLPESQYRDVMQIYTKTWFEHARNEVSTADHAAFVGGQALAYAKALSGKIPNLRQVGRGLFVPGAYLPEPSDNVELLISKFEEGYTYSRKRIPAKVQTVALSYLSQWCRNVIGDVEPRQVKQMLFHQKHAVFPFDHFSRNRTFLGGIMHLPPTVNPSYFPYIKGCSFPLVSWYSERQTNDIFSWFTSYGETLEGGYFQHGSHEAAHLFAIDFLVNACLQGNTHCWLSEGIALYYGNSTTYIMARIREEAQHLTIRSISDTRRTSLRYGASFLLTIALAAKLSGSMKRMEQGITHLICGTLNDLAQDIVRGRKRKANNPHELLLAIDPSLKERNARVQLEKTMLEIFTSACSNRCAWENN